MNSTAPDTTETQHTKQQGPSLEGRVDISWLVRNKSESPSLWILHRNQYQPSFCSSKIMSHKKIMIFISKMITQKTQATQSRCKPIKTPVWHGCPSLCPSVCGVHSVSRVHLSILNPLQRRSHTRSNSLPGDHLWPLITTQNADFTPCCIRRVTRRAPEGLHCIFRNARFKAQDARTQKLILHPTLSKEGGPFWFNTDPRTALPSVFIDRARRARFRALITQSVWRWMQTKRCEMGRGKRSNPSERSSYWKLQNGPCVSR